MRRIAWTIDERRKVVAQLYQDKMPVKDIAETMGRKKSVVYDDISREFPETGNLHPQSSRGSRAVNRQDG